MSCAKKNKDKKLKIGSIIYYVDSGKIEKSKIIGIKDDKFLIDDGSCGTEREVFATENLAKLFLSKILSNAKFKVGDFVLKERNSYDWTDIGFVKEIKIDYANKLKYDINLLNSDSEYTEFAEEDLTKINESFVKERMYLLDQIKEIKKNEKEFEELRRNYNKYLNEFSDKLTNKYFEFKNRYFKCFGIKEFEKVFKK